MNVDLVNLEVLLKDYLKLMNEKTENWNGSWEEKAIIDEKIQEAKSLLDDVKRSLKCGQLLV